MERSVDIVCVIDACSLIRLIRIDEDEFLIKRLRRLRLFITEFVFNEVRENLTSSLYKSNLSKSDKDYFAFIWTTKLDYFRKNLIEDSVIYKDVGEDFYEQVKALSGYKKRDNGELRSVSLALYLSRLEPTKVFFHTDDFPAKTTFEPFFIFQQIGAIEDSVDLLILLYRLDDEFLDNDLDNYLSSLLNEYASEVKELRNKLEEYYEQYTGNDRQIRTNLRDLIHKLNANDFKNINVIKELLLIKKKKLPNITNVFTAYKDVFLLETPGSNAVDKISFIRKKLNTIFCLWKATG